MCPKQYAESLASQLTGVEDGAVLYTVKGMSPSHFPSKVSSITSLGAAGLLSIIPGSASIVNQVIAKFLSRFPHRRSDLVPPALSVEVRMTTALQNLARVSSNGSIATRNPLSSLSFSCLPKDIVKAQEELITQYARNRHQAFSPLGPDGKPLRKYDNQPLFNMTNFDLVTDFLKEEKNIGSKAGRTDCLSQVRSFSVVCGKLIY